MPANTNSKTSRDTGRLSAGEQPEYGYEPWDADRGNFRHLDNGEENYNAGSNDRNDYGKPTASQDESGLSRNQDNAVNNLRNAENNAVSNRKPSYSPDSQSLYTGTGKDKNQANNGKTGIMSKLKGKGAVITILLSLVGGGVFLGTSNSLLAPAIETLFTEATDTQYTSYMLRVPFLTKYALQGTAATHTSWTGVAKYNHFSKSFQNRLAAQGITVEGSGSNKSLVFTQTTDSGTTTTTIGATGFESEFNDNAEFRNAFMKAKRGRIATFFDKVANTLYNKFGLRNLFAKFRSTNDADTDLTNFNDTMSPKFDNDTSNLNSDVETTKQETVEKRDPNTGEVIMKPGTNEPETEVVEVPDPHHNTETATSNNSPETANAKAESMLTSYAKTVAQVGTWACTFLKFGSAISVAIAANEIYQSINYFMGFSENISKMKYGLGDESAIHEVMNFMTTPAHTKVTNFGKLTVTNIDSENATFDTGDDLEQTGAPVESGGMQFVLAGVPINRETTKAYSLERVTNSLFSAITSSKNTLNICSGISVATSLISIGAGILTGGASYMVGGFIAKLKGIAIGIVASGLIKFLIPTVASVFFTNAFETATGIPAGELFTKGAAASNTRVSRTGSGQSLANRNTANAFNRATNTVLAMDAELDRLNYSPFDITNRNTFFGSIAYSLLPTITSSKFNGIASLLRSVSSSLSSLTGRVSADGEGSSYMTTYGDCSTLDDIDAVGDMYCNPITTTSLDTVDLPPDNETYQEVIADDMVENSCDSDGNGCSIDKGSDLARYISYCANRYSPFGVADQNILGELSVSGQIDETIGIPVSSLAGAVPFVGDGLALLDAAAEQVNMAWADGSKCVDTSGGTTSSADNDNYKNNDFWNKKGKYYQRYIEDQRILEQMGAYEGSVNPVLAYMEEYEAEQAEKYADVDSTVAYLSRISGLNIENTEIVLAFVGYYSYVDQYDPTIALAMDGEASDIQEGEKVIAQAKHDNVYVDTPYSSDPQSEPVYIAREHIIYADIRNRSYTV